MKEWTYLHLTSLYVNPKVLFAHSSFCSNIGYPSHAPWLLLETVNCGKESSSVYCK